MGVNLLCFRVGCGKIEYYSMLSLREYLYHEESLPGGIYR